MRVLFPVLAMAAVLMQETSSLGVRLRTVDRFERPRRTLTVETPFGAIPVKIADGDGLARNVAPEFESCREAATRTGATAKAVYQAALAAALAASDDGD